MSPSLATKASPTHAQGAASDPRKQEAALEPLYPQQDNRAPRPSPPTPTNYVVRAQYKGPPTQNQEQFSTC
jgi:hypothetical protein